MSASIENLALKVSLLPQDFVKFAPLLVDLAELAQDGFLKLQRVGFQVLQRVEFFHFLHPAN